MCCGKQRGSIKETHFRRIYSAEVNKCNAMLLILRCRAGIQVDSVFANHVK